MIFLKKSQKGFTLLELLLYVAIVSIMMATLIPFAWNIIEGGVKSTVEQEVYSNVRYISERLKYEIRNATGINSVAATKISLSTAYANTNPTIIGLSGNNLTIQQGAGSPVNLNSQNASISALIFTSYKSADNKTKNIQFTFTVIASNSGTLARQEYQASASAESDAEIRSN